MQLDLSNKISPIENSCGGCSSKFCSDLFQNPLTNTQYCNFLSKRIGKEFITNSHLCKQECANNGPYNNRSITEEQEKKFVTDSIKKYNSNFMESIHKVLMDYNKIYDIKIPKFYNEIEENMNFLKNYKGFKKFTLTGDCLIVDDYKKLKSIDIILWFESMGDWLGQNIKQQIPSFIENIKTNFYIFTGTIEETSSMFLFQLDVEDKILYTSKWFDLKLLKIPDDFEVKYSKCEYYNYEFKTHVNGSHRDVSSFDHPVDEISESDTTIKKPKLGWYSVAESWNKASQFLNAVNSRGIISTALDYINIDSSKGERVSEDLYKLRYESCFGNEHKNIPPCVFLSKDSDDMFFCGGCGCGSNKLAVLTSKDEKGYSKLHYPKLECPLGKPGFSNHLIK